MTSTAYTLDPSPAGVSPPGTAGNPVVAGAVSALDPAKDNWLSWRHPDYQADKAHTCFALDYYSGEVMDEAKLPIYLVRRAQGEPIKAYNERKKLADYENHLGTIVDSLAGILYASDEDTARTFHPPEQPDGGLGDPKDQTTTAGRLLIDADGMGCGWETLHKNLASLITLTGGGKAPAAWGLVTSPNGSGRLQYLNPLLVQDWVYGDLGQLVEVKVQECVVVRSSVKEKPVIREQYVLYDTKGWQRYVFSADKRLAIPLEGPGNSGRYSFTDREGNPALPIFPVRVPIRRMVGWLLARNAHAIFNLESARDWLLYMAHFPKLVLSAGDALWEELKLAIENGANLLQEDQAQGSESGHRYIGPPTEAAKLLSEVLKQKIVDLYIKGFREYGDAAREVTATEAQQKVAAGVGAFLQMLAAALDDAENQALWRIAQVEYPAEPARHFIAKTERSKEFMPADVQAMVQRLIERYFGKDQAVPVGRAGQVAIATQVAEYEGLNLEAADIERAVDMANLKAQLETLRELPASPTLQVQIGLKLAEAFGVIPPPADQKDGTAPELDPKLRDIIEAELTRAAESAALATARLAELEPRSSVTKGSPAPAAGEPPQAPAAPASSAPPPPPQPAGPKTKVTTVQRSRKTGKVAKLTTTEG